MLDRTLASIENLRAEFQTKAGSVVGVSDVSISIAPGECVAIVGESGSGKSVTSLSLMRLVEFSGGKITAGRILFDRGAEGSVDLAAADHALIRTIRGNEIGMIFQEPMTALNPVFTIERQLTEGVRLHKGLGRKEARSRALDMLEKVRIQDPERCLKQYPHELSGGMRQRVLIAMALACEPRLLIADEPTTALDVTIQADILALIDRLRRDTGTAVLFITHDMAVVAQVADRVVVMKDGQQVEEGPVSQIFSALQQAYTRDLLAAVPRLGEMRGKPFPQSMPLKADAPDQPMPIIGTVDPILEVKNICTRFPVKRGLWGRQVANLHAVEDLSLTLCRGRTFSLVGESGSGKNHGRSVDPAVGAAARGADNVGRCRSDGAGCARIAPGAPKYADGVSRSLCQSGPSNAIVGSGGRTAA